MKYAYEDLSEDQFEKLVVLLCQRLLGMAVQGFAKGVDGGRDAKFVGTAELLPSKAAPWAGTTIIQAKHTSGYNRSFSEGDFYNPKSENTVVGKEIPRIQKLRKAMQLDAFDFRQQDKARTKEVVEEIDARIAALNSQRYSLSQNRKKIVASLEEDQILFNPDEAQRLFKEVGVLFAGQIMRDYDQLIAFNIALTVERRKYLQEERTEVEGEIKAVTAELNTLGKRRSDMLGFLSSTDVFAKYKQLTDDLVTMRADIATLEKQRGFLHRLQELRAEIRALSEECTHLQSQVEINVEAQSADGGSFFSSIRLYFSEIVEDVTAHKALLSVYANKEGHLEFRAEVLDDAGKATSADLGHTYRKLLCIAFDLAVLRMHLDQKFPRFVFHDGVFESLDDRKKANLLAVIREYADLGVQPIITLIDSDTPPADDDGTVFGSDEIVLTLHDAGPEGRLFRMKAW